MNSYILMGALLALLILFGCTTVDDPVDLELTWKYAWVEVPGKVAATQYGCVGNINLPDLQQCLSKIPENKKWPLVIFVHGCAGQNAGYQQFLKSIGYASISPSSFSRPGRKAVCKGEPGKQTILEMRKAEAKYAFHQARKFHWVDSERIILMGQSEGGKTVATYAGSEFKAHIILGWTCNNRWHGWQDGIWAPANTPVLSVSGTRDRFINQSTRGNCGTRFGNRPDSRAVVIENGGHNVIAYPEAREAIAEFLKQHAGD